MSDFFPIALLSLIFLRSSVALFPNRLQSSADLMVLLTLLGFEDGQRRPCDSLAPSSLRTSISFFTNALYHSFLSLRESSGLYHPLLSFSSGHLVPCSSLFRVLSVEKRRAQLVSLLCLSPSQRLVYERATAYDFLDGPRCSHWFWGNMDLIFG